MNPITLILSNLIYRPIFNLLIVFLSLFGGNLGLSIIALTLAVRLILLRSSLAQNDMQKHMTNIQPKLQEIQEKYKDQPEKMSAETMKILKTQGAGPLKGCLMSLVQIPVFLGLFFVIRDFATGHMDSFATSLYSFFNHFGIYYTNLANINHHFLGMDLLIGKNIYITALAAVLVYFQMKITMLNQKQTAPKAPNMPDMSSMMGFMNIFLVVSMSGFVYSMPTGIGLYIITTTLFGLLQLGWQYRELIKIKLGLIKK